MGIAVVNTAGSMECAGEDVDEMEVSFFFRVGLVCVRWFGVCF